MAVDEAGGCRLAAAYGLYYLDNQPIIWRAADVPYYRLAPTQWAREIGRAADAGCNAVSCRVPWAWHETRPGEVDLSGRRAAQRDLPRFLDVLASSGLVGLLRPGPHGPGEPGYETRPRWLADTIPEALARGPGGQPLGDQAGPLFSLRHPAFQERVRGWFGALAAALRAYDGGTVVAWLLDEEPERPFRRAAGDLDRGDEDTRQPLGFGRRRGGRRADQARGAGLGLDFNPDTVARYRAYLRGKYGDAATLAREWRVPVAQIDVVQPPRADGAWAEVLDWQAFLEGYVAEYLAALQGQARGAGVRAALGAAQAAAPGSPQNPHLAAAVDLPGYAGGAAAGMAGAPFSASLAAIRHGAYAGETRPLTAWRLGAERLTAADSAPGAGPDLAPGALPDPAPGAAPGAAQGRAVVAAVVAAVAHGVRGYALPYLAGGGAASGLGRFQAFVREHEEELTASVEVRDPVALVTYQPYGRATPLDLLAQPRAPEGPENTWASMGFGAALLVAGYNPVCVDLEAATDDTLGDFRAAVFPSRGFIALEDYGKLVVFTLRGGSLITYPTPAMLQPDGTPFKSTFLWPHQPFAAPATPGEAAGAVARAQRAARALAGRVLGGSGAGRAPDPGGGARLDAGAPLTRGDGSPVSVAGQVMRFREGGEVLLRAGGASAGYRAQVYSGTSTLLGTGFGDVFVTPAYDGLAAAQRLAVRRLVLDIVEEICPRQIAPDDTLEVETVARLSPDGGCLLFVVNRLGVQRGVVRFPVPAALNLERGYQVETLFGGAGSRAEARAGGVWLEMQPGDVLVARVT